MTPNSSKIFLLILIPTFFMIFDYYKKEPFLNMEKKYKNMKSGLNGKLEGMIKRLPAKINLRRGVRRIKRKFISY
jgi:hypothetical protein